MNRQESTVEDTHQEAEMVISHTQVVQYYEEAEDLSRDSRELAEKCRDYYDHKQWTEDEAKTLRRRKQPVITRNRIKPKVDFLKGLEADTRTDPKAFPRNPQDDESAEAATDAIRFVCDHTKFPRTRSSVFENLAIEGTGGAEVYAKQGPRGIEIQIKHFHWDRIFYDPHSREKDFSDALYFGGVIWMDYEQAKRQYPDSEGALENTIAQESLNSQTYDDAPRMKWADTTRKRIRIVMMEYNQGDDWYRCEFTKGGWLQRPEKSAYVDENGQTVPSLIFQSSHVDREGNRYGWVRAWLDIQDEINKRASKYLHLVSVRQTFSNGTAGSDAAKLKRELAKPDGHLEFVAGEFGKDFGVIPTMDMAAAHFNLLQESKQEIDSVGVNAALAGGESRDLSGRAIGRLQAGGSTEIKPLFDALSQFNQRVYTAIWQRIKQFWTAEKWIRITDDESNIQWVGLNQPITLGDELMNQYGELPPEFMNDPRMSITVGKKNDVAVMDVDIILEDVPDLVNVMQEQFDALTKIFPAIPDAQKPAALEMLIESSSIRNKSQFLERLRGGGEQDPQAMMMQQQQQAKQMQAVEEQRQSELAYKDSQTNKNNASAAKDMAEIQKQAVEANQMIMQ